MRYLRRFIYHHKTNIMNKVNIISIFTLTLFLCTLISCGNKDDNTTTETPPEELIIGKWQSEVHREDGAVIADSDYREFEFKEDGTVQIEQFESDGSPADSTEDNWTMTSSSDETTIEFDGEDRPYKIISISNNAMTLEYEKEDEFEPGTFVDRLDDFVRIDP